MLEVIIHGDSEFELYNDNWSPEDRRNALAYLKAVERSSLYLKRSRSQATREKGRYCVWCRYGSAMYQTARVTEDRCG
jgi:hypothetical protein